MPRERETAYNTLVRPQLEYASAVWDPNTDKLIRQIDQVQRRAARWTVNNFCRQASVIGIIENLGWRTLEQRRADARLCLFYKVVHGLVAVPLPDHVQYSNRISLYCHSMTFRQVSTSTNYYKSGLFLYTKLGPVSGTKFFPNWLKKFPIDLKHSQLLEKSQFKR